MKNGLVPSFLGLELLGIIMKVYKGLLRNNHDTQGKAVRERLKMKMMWEDWLQFVAVRWYFNLHVDLVMWSK